MKNKILIVSLFSLMGTTIASKDGDQLAVSLAKVGTELYAAHQQYQQSLPNEKNFRRKIYWLDKNNPNWYLLSDYQKDFDYHIANLIGHIKVLEDKLDQKKNGFHSAAILRGALTSALSALCGYGAYVCRQQGELAQADAYASQWVRDVVSQHAMDGVVVLGILSAVFAGLAIQNFDKTYRYVARMLERLDRDKRILNLLETEKATKNDNKNVVSEAALQLINSLVEVITNFSQPAVIVPVVNGTSENSVSEVVQA
ncbi:MAG TPA: hypothetical protein VHX42_04535 [Candidatus Babeliales bacterium]|jgi:hypothetical protein|nr:hypothetical protein [Candidatus Babeliales bacterium]